MTLEVKHGKVTNIPQSAYVDGKLAEKSTIAGADGGSENQRINGVNTTLANSVVKGTAGSLDRDSFARGMARIDEEVRKAQLLGRATVALVAGWNAGTVAGPFSSDHLLS